MRIVIEKKEYFIFKNCFYSSPNIYYKKNNTIIEKYLKKENKSNNKIIDMIIKSTSIPKINKEPEIISISVEDQLNELKLFLKYYFNVEMDERNRFFYKKTKTIIKESETFLFKEIDEVIFLNWKDIINLYNANNVNFINNKYLKDKYENIPTLEEKYMKKYVILNLKKSKKGFFIENKYLITYPV